MSRARRTPRDLHAIALAIAATACPLVSAPGIAQGFPVRAAGAASVPWHVNGSDLPAFRFALDSTVARGGRASLRITAAAPPDGFGGATTSLPARAASGAYAGRRVHVSAAFRTAAMGPAGAALWLRADGADGQSVGFATTQGHPVTGTVDWTTVAIDLDVPASAAVLAFGVLARDEGTLWVDDVQVSTPPPAGVVSTTEPPPVVRYGFEDAAAIVLPPAPAPAAFEAPRALAGRGLENLVAFTRLLGYVRLFHPSDEGAATNWDAFAVRGLRAVERAPDADSLTRTLRALFAPVAPTVAVFRAGAAAPPAPRVPGVAAPASLGIVFWVHNGFNPDGYSGRGNIYESGRVRGPAARDGRPLAVSIANSFSTGPDSIVPPDPRAPLRVELGAGVAASVPLALYTLAPSLPDSMRVPHPARSTERFSVRDRATRLADVALLWTVLQHFYPYFDRVHTDWPAALRTALGEAAADGDPAAFQRTMSRLAAALHDGHAGVWHPVIMAVPALRLGFVEGRVVVTAVADSAAGVVRGDELLAVDGRAIAGALRDAESLVSGATPQWVRSRALEGLLAGPSGTTTTLRLRDPLRPSAAARDVRVTRLGMPIAERSGERIAEPRSGVFYVDLSRIDDEDFATALPRLHAARAIVFDMRGYPTHVNTPTVLGLLSDTMMRSARFEVPTVTRPDGRGVVYRDGGWFIPRGTNRLAARAVFLTGGGAISYAETTMGIVEAYHLGDIVGGTTAGTNGNIDTMALPGGYTAVWTGMRVRKHDGTPHHGVGIAPTVPADRTLRGVREGRDEVLERALTLLSPTP